MKPEFYIGYLEKAPNGVAAHIKKVVLGLVVLVLFLAWLLASQQRGFAGSTYEFAEETTIRGFLTGFPIPELVIYHGTSNGKHLNQVIPLVEFGKKGGDALVGDQSKWVELSGNLIFFEGKSLLEIKDPSTIKEIEVPSNVPDDWSLDWTSEADFDSPPIDTFLGEIIDAKCYFGVMKPGHGKPHRSCAIRCISGGIPAVLKVRDKLDRIDYHLIYMMEGSGKDLAARIGETVEVNGTLSQHGDWSIVEIDNNQSVTPLSLSVTDYSSQLTMCE